MDRDLVLGEAKNSVEWTKEAHQESRSSHYANIIVLRPVNLHEFGALDARSVEETSVDDNICVLVKLLICPCF